MGSECTPKSSNVGVYRETGRLPILFDGIKLSCDYYARCRELSDDTLVKKAFLEQKRLDLDWYHNISAVESNYSRGNSKLNSINVFQNQRSTFIAKLFQYINQSPKLEFYKAVKNTLNEKITLTVSSLNTDPH